MWMRSHGPIDKIVLCGFQFIKLVVILEIILPVLVNSELNLTQTSVIRAKKSAEHIITQTNFAKRKMFIELIFAIFAPHKIIGIIKKNCNRLI